MFKRIRMALTLLLMAALLGLCISGIFYINQITNEQYSALSLESAQESTYTSYSMFYPGKMDLQQIAAVSGTIESPKEDFIEELVYSGDLDDLAVQQGDGFAEGDLLFDGSSQYYAKYAGIVDRVYTEGSKVHILLADYEDRYVSVQIPEAYLQYIAKGDSISFQYLEEEKQGEITYISCYVTDGTVTAQIDFSDEEMSMYIHAAVSVQVVKAKADDVLAVPENALIQSGDTWYLRVKSGDDSVLKEVTTGMTSSDGYVEIRDGITESDVILIDNTASASETDSDEEAQ